MIEEIATVTAIQSDKVTVKSHVKSSCSSCKQVDSCASGQVAQAIPQLNLTMDVTCKESVNVGDSVVIAIPENALLSTAAKVYLLPLFGLILGSGLGQFFIVQGVFSHELQALLLGVSSGFLGYVLAKLDLRSAKLKALLTPKLLRKVI